MILLITNKTDLTTDFVVAALRSRSAEFARFNTEELLERWRFSWTADSWTAIDDDGNRLDGDRIVGVYYRRPRAVRPLDGTAGDAGEFVRRESRAFLRGLYSTTSGCWISTPAAIEAAEDKLLQLKVAGRLAFAVPTTLITNDPVAARDFCRCYEAVIKPLSSGFLSDDPPLLSYCEAIDPTWDFNEVALCPHLIQERIPKVADVRVTVVDSTVFACRIDSQAYDETKLDWRRATGLGIPLPHRIVPIDPIVTRTCADLVCTLGLRFGAIDLVERPDGSYCFLEVNPNGQWAWIEQRTGAPISQAIAEALLQPAPGAPA